MVNYGGAIAAGAQGFMVGQDRALDRQAKQQALTQQSAQLDMAKQSFQTSEDLKAKQLELANIQLQEQIKGIANAKTKESLFNAFDRDTLTDFNAVIKNDKNLQRLFPGIESVEKVDMKNPTYANQAANMESPILVTSIKNGTIVREVRDMDRLKIMSGYSTYKNTRDLELNTQKAAATKSKLNSQMIEKFIAENPDASVKELQAFLGTSKPMSYSEQQNKFKLERDMNDAQVTDYIDNNPTQFREMLTTGNMDTKVGNMSLYSMAKKSQGSTKVATGRRDYLDGMVSTLDNTNRLRKKMASSEFDWNALSKGMDELTKITGSEWRDLDATEKKNMLDKFSFNSDLKTVMAGYIKAMSGAAVSDQERGFYEGAILGGNWATKETALASMDGFVSGLKNGMDSAIGGMIGNTPADYLDYKSRVGKIGIDTSIPVAETQEEKPGITETVAGNIKSLWGKVTGSTKTVADY